MIEYGEELISDARLADIEAALRKRFDLPEDAEFVTWTVPAQWRERSGVEVLVPAMAMFAIVSSDPRPGHDDRKMTIGQMELKQWLSVDREFRHRVGYQDPAMGAFRRIAPVHADMIRNLRELQAPDPKLAPKLLN